ncbi:hypothetical protein L1987_04578 [Smallanthus sonchifolius]|uniref:Uncharacterized protein n=1 Tax=Smallanthus sonchifolius TaxID=185202 RepID=A0ACB9JSY3_9ASTR|nr:hypothetical protein L1987_04578 [Smallanthus sonchifolius]
MVIKHILLVFLFLAFRLSSSAKVTYNVVTFGAKPDGRSDTKNAFLKAWNLSCASTSPAIIYVPTGRYLIAPALTFSGIECKSRGITFNIGGTLVAPSSYNAIGNAQVWIKFYKVNHVTISGGTLDAQGSSLWACKASGKACPKGSTTLGIYHSQNIVISKLRSQRATTASRSGNSNIWIEKVVCGPGHGISIGSLGWELEEPGVQNVTVKTTTFIGTQNGLRIKTWARNSNGFVKDVVFKDATMMKVKYPIIIDGNYCPDNENCPSQVSGVKINNVVYEDVHGTSAKHAWQSTCGFILLLCCRHCFGITSTYKLSVTSRRVRKMMRWRA